MKVMSVKHATYEQIENFLSRNENIDKSLLFEKGFVVEIQGQIEASFILEELDSGGIWLKQLYITQHHAAKLPVLLETILQIAKKKQADTVYVHSHQPVVDILLEALEFKQEKEMLPISKKPVVAGNWWCYHVS